MRFNYGLFLAMMCLTDAVAQSGGDVKIREKFYLSTTRGENSTAITKISAKLDAPITDDDLKELAQFTDVKFISLNGVKINGTGLKHLAELKNLEKIDLSFTTLNSDGFKNLAQMKQLKKLNLLNTNYTRADLKELTTLRNLESLWLGQNFKCDEAGYLVLGEFKKLQVFTVDNSNFGDEGLKIVAGLPDLRAIRLAGSKVTDDGMQHLAQATKLEQFQGNYSLTDKGLSALAKIESLRMIDFYGSRITVEKLLQMPHAQKWTNISLDFRGDTANADTEKVKAGLPNCKFTNISWNFER